MHLGLKPSHSTRLVYTDVQKCTFLVSISIKMSHLKVLYENKAEILAVWDECLNEVSKLEANSETAPKKISSFHPVETRS